MELQCPVRVDCLEQREVGTFSKLPDFSHVLRDKAVIEGSFVPEGTSQARDLLDSLGSSR
ncbi:hypothetical protein GA0115234_106919 [Streptomyces sp. DvalAA-43]|nr:hypothetical protein GA0115234_106919 [Streptomyces sp. DvalAA-43]